MGLTTVGDVLEGMDEAGELGGQLWVTNVTLAGEDGLNELVTPCPATPAPIITPSHV